MFKEFISQDGQTMYRPSLEMAGYMAQDDLAFCAHCTQMHEGVVPDAYRALCSDCGQNKVFGHFSFGEIA